MGCGSLEKWRVFMYFFYFERLIYLYWLGILVSWLSLCNCLRCFIYSLMSCVACTHCPDRACRRSAWPHTSSSLPPQVDTPGSTRHLGWTDPTHRAPAPPGPTPTLTPPGEGRGGTVAALEQHKLSHTHTHKQQTHTSHTAQNTLLKKNKLMEITARCRSCCLTPAAIRTHRKSSCLHLRYTHFEQANLL